MQRMLERFEDVRREDPSTAFAAEWVECLERDWSEAELAAGQSVCSSRSGQGVISTLVAVKAGDGLVPVIESRLDRAQGTREVVVDVTGGPGQLPFHNRAAMSEQIIVDGRLVDYDLEETPYYQILRRGFTVASVGYWGTSIRTLEAPGEIESAMSDVRVVIDHYRDAVGEEPPLIIASLGTHLALGALGRERLEAMHTLALVPVMDGLQQHLDRVAQEHAEAQAKGDLSGQWTTMNVYALSSEGITFDHARMMPMHEYIPVFMGDADLPWRNVRPRSPCSKVILGSEDPRTSDYLAASGDLPDFIEVWDSDHDIFLDAPEQSRALFAQYGDCIGRELRVRP